MASDWIKMRPELLREPEVIGIARRLSVSREHVVGCLLSVWGVADAHAVSRPCPDDNGTTEGHLSRYCPADIDREAGLNGFAMAMEAEGWLISHDDGVSFPEWDVHNSRSAKTRGCEQKKKARQRGNVPVMSRPCPDDNGTKQGTREEKRREEVLEDKKEPAQPQTQPMTNEEILAKASELVASWKLPAGCEAPRFRGALARWVAARYRQYGWFSEINWDNAKMKYFRWTPDQWFEAITSAAVGGNKWLAEYAAEDTKKTQSPPRSKTKELTPP